MWWDGKLRWLAPFSMSLRVFMPGNLGMEMLSIHGGRLLQPGLLAMQAWQEALALK